MSIAKKQNSNGAFRFAWDADKTQRYRRHILLDEIGIEGQERIAASNVLIVGAGGLGSPVITYLAAAGVGHIGVVDGDIVELSNLQRQVVFSTSDLGRKKAVAAGERIKEINPDVRVEVYDEFLSLENVGDLIGQYDFVCEGSDNYATKLLVNDTCVRKGKPFTVGSLSRFEGQVMTHTDGSACWRCLYGAAPEQDEKEPVELGVLGSVPGIIGAVEATEAIKFIVGSGKLLTNRLLSFNALTMETNVFEFGCNPACPLCGNTEEKNGNDKDYITS